MVIRLVRTIVSQQCTIGSKRMGSTHRETEKPNAFGSLTYGGYDKARFIMNNATFPFDADDSRKPSLNIRSIVSQDFANTTVNLLPEGPAYSLIDFAEPQMWLPVSACNAFAKAFNLTYDNSTDLYLVDPNTRARLLEQNATISFGLGPTANPADRVNIVLPYSAFDQQAAYPIYPNATKYFPIRRAENETMYTIGRTFFQEAYVIIDYDRGNFSVHQASFPATTEKQEIVPISSPEPSDVAQHAIVSRSPGLSKGAIAGISVGLAVSLTFLILLGYWLFRRRSAAKRKAALKQKIRRIEVADKPTMESGGAAFYEKDGRHFVEMEGDHGEVFHELADSPDGSDMSISETNLSAIIEYYEIEGTNVVSEEDAIVEVSVRNGTPPGWI
jgi:hypothetical protein